jgi:hypothetical protein
VSGGRSIDRLVKQVGRFLKDQEKRALEFHEQGKRFLGLLELAMVMVVGVQEHHCSLHSKL